MKLLRWLLKQKKKQKKKKKWATHIYVARTHKHIRGRRIYASPAVNELTRNLMIAGPAS